MTANAGYHAYATGDVLTSAQVQYNLQNQTVMYFATTTARDAALTGAILVEGMVSYTPATGVMYYNGSAWTAVGASVPTSYGFTAGKNKIINGDFGVWQRGTSFTSATGYTADRWTTGGFATTVTQQAFTAGTAPVSGYESAYFLQAASVSGGVANLVQKIEDVRTYAGQSVTLSYWAKIDSAANITTYFTQNFGTGGSTTVDNINITATSTTTSWARYTVSFTVPSISSKTVGTSSFLALNIYAPASRTMSIWGVQLEAGSSATSFQTATGTIQGELAACQRYYYRLTGSASFGTISSFGNAASGSAAYPVFVLPVTMRTAPTSVDSANVLLSDLSTNYTGGTITLDSGATSPNLASITYTTSGLTTYRPYVLRGNNNGAAYLGVSAEL